MPPFNSAEGREARYDARKCDEYLKMRRERYGEGLCVLCVYVCPYGRRAAAQHILNRSFRSGR